MTKPAAHGRFVLVLLVLLLVLWVRVAFSRYECHAWLLEHALLVLAIALQHAAFRSFPLSRISYALIFVFLCLHTIGAHYTYAEVPYDAWFESLTGRTFNSLVGWKRNNFDRVVH